MDNKKLTIRVLFYVSHFLIVLLAIFVNVYLFSSSFRTWLFKENPKLSGQRNTLNVNIASGVYFGVTLDWEGGDLPLKFEERFGKAPAVYQHFIEVTDRVQKVKELKYIIDGVSSTNALALALTILPNGGLQVLNDSTFDQIARIASTINKLGIPVLMRFGHEMNGNWYPYGQKPTAYKNAFIKLTQTIRKYTTLTKMVWAPNNAIGYPWTEGASSNKVLLPIGEDFQALDTNRDGTISSLDDPFTPYYPGDQWVDWIGFSSFYFGDQNVPNKNSIPPDNYFISTIQAKQTNWDIYDMFCKGKNKPFAIMETASAYFPENVQRNDPSNLQIKQAWWKQVFSVETFQKFPLLKLVIWFDIIKKEEGLANQQVTRDFKISGDSEIRKLFRKEIPSNVYFADSRV